MTQNQDRRTDHPFVTRPNRTLINLAVPALFSLVAEPLTGLADTAFVARLGAGPVAALGVGTMAFSSIFWVFAFLGVGTQTEVAHAEGENDRERSRKVVSLSCLLATGIGVLILAAFIGFLSPISSLFGARGQVNVFACDYMYYRLLGAPAVLVSLSCFGGMRGFQDMRTPLMVAVGINVINVLLDWLLIFGAGPVPALGVGGAAMASTVSQWVGAIWCLWVIRRRLGLTWNVRGAGISRIIRIGGDMFVRTGVLLVFLALCTRVANQFGAAAGAGYQATRQFYMFTAMFLDAFAITGQSLVGYFYGGANREQARRVARYVIWWSLGTGFFLTLVMVAGTNLGGWLLVPDSARQTFEPGWYMLALGQPLIALACATDGIHWGTGDFRYLRNAMVVSSLAGILALVGVKYLQLSPILFYIWLVCTLWAAFRSGFGLARIWPGVGRAPLAGEE